MYPLSQVHSYPSVSGCVCFRKNGELNKQKCKQLRYDEYERQRVDSYTYVGLSPFSDNLARKGAPQALHLNLLYAVV